MKKFLKVLLTIWITLLLLVLGGSFCFKTLVKDTATSVIQEEFEKSIYDVVEEGLPNSITLEQEEQVKDFLENNSVLNDMMDRYFDEALAIFSGEKDILNIDWENEINRIFNEVQPILRENGITITEEEKNQILSELPTQELNEQVSQLIIDTKQEMPQEVNMLFTIFQFVTSTMMKGIIFVLILVSLGLIMLLDKNCYGWLKNLGISSIITGIIYLIFYYFGKGVLNSMILEEIGITIPFDSLFCYGGIVLVIGTISIIINITLTRRKVQKQGV